MRHLIWFLLLHFIPATATAQLNKADSLQALIKQHSQRDTFRINLLQQFCTETYDNAAALSAADEMISIARQLNHPGKEANGYMCRAGALLEEGKDSLYLEAVDKARSIYDLIGDPKGAAVTFRGKGRYYERMGFYNKAIDQYNMAIKKTEESNAKNLLMYINSDIGNCYYVLGNYTKAIEYYLKSQKDAESSNELRTQAVAINNIALVNKALKKYATAIDLYRRAMTVYTAAKDSAGYAGALQGIGIVYDLQLKSDSALNYYYKALGINLRNNYKLNAAQNYSNIGIVYNDLNNYSGAYQYLNRSIQLYKELNKPDNIKRAEINIGELYCSAPDSFFTRNQIPLAERYQKAVGIFKEILKYGEETEDIALQHKGWMGMSMAYEKMDDYKNAYSAVLKSNALKDSLQNEEQVENTTRQTDQFEFEKKEAVTNAKHLLEIKQEQTVKNAISTGAGILLLGAIVSFVFYKRKRDAVAKQQEAELKSEMANVEMKALRAQMNPHFIFNSLNSIGDYISKNNIPEADRYLGKFARLMRMILENSEQKSVPLEDDLKALELYMQLEALRMNNKFTYQIKVDDDIDRQNTLVPPLILQPFVENSIWHGIAKKQESGSITIHIKKENEQMINCIVEDDGIGRAQAAGIKTTSGQSAQSSLGMKITQSRIDILNKIKNTKAAVQLIDLAQGLRVEVKLPLTTNF